MLCQQNHLNIWYSTLFQYCYINATTWVKTESVLTSIMVSDVFISGEFKILNNACWEGLLICKNNSWIIFIIKFCVGSLLWSFAGLFKDISNTLLVNYHLLTNYLLLVDTIMMIFQDHCGLFCNFQGIFLRLFKTCYIIWQLLPCQLLECMFIYLMPKLCPPNSREIVKYQYGGCVNLVCTVWRTMASCTCF